MRSGILLVIQVCVLNICLRISRTWTFFIFQSHNQTWMSEWVFLSKFYERNTIHLILDYIPSVILYLQTKFFWFLFVYVKEIVWKFRYEVIYMHILHIYTEYYLNIKVVLQKSEFLVRGEPNRPTDKNCINKLLSSRLSLSIDIATVTHCNFRPEL